MSKRYYLCDVVGIGSENDPKRPVVADFNVNWVGEINSAGTQAFVLVNAINHSSLLSDNRVDAMPDFPLDAKVNAMHASAKANMQAAILARGLIDDASSADGYRDAVRSLGQQMNPNFDENNFDVSE